MQLRQKYIIGYLLIFIFGCGLFTGGLISAVAQYLYLSTISWSAVATIICASLLICTGILGRAVLLANKKV